MITCDSIGQNGRLGNQLFQFSTLFSVGFLRGFKITIPENQKISETFQISSEKLVSGAADLFSSFKEKQFLFDPNIFLLSDNTNLFGYFQSGNYFRHCQDALRKELLFHTHIETKASNFISKLENRPYCALHIRRGDYTSLSHIHKNLSSDYYQKACNTVKSNIPNAKFLVFSDDVQFCKQFFTDSQNFEIVDINDDITELCIMSKCKIHIIANSSFSWWGAWLSNSKAVIAPCEWFAEQGPKDWNSIYEPDWIKI